MTDRLSLTIAQINPTVGDMDGNIAAIRTARREAGATDLLVFGELSVAGYPPEDLVLKRAFQDRVEEAVRELARDTADGGPGLLIGAPWRLADKLHNAALLLDGGDIRHIALKRELPNYGVFDEKRVFVEGPFPGPVEFRGARLGVMICEDMWFDAVSERLRETGAEILVVLNASPYEVDKRDARFNHAVARVAESGLPLVYVNLVGGQDELVFDGDSFVLNADQRVAARTCGWDECLVETVWNRGADGWVCASGEIVPRRETMEEIYRAMVIGLRDYVNKNSFPGVLIGMSGGIDSALSAAVAVDAIGADRVRLIMMPSPHTSRESLDDARSAAKLLDCAIDEISIEPAMAAFAEMLAGRFKDAAMDATEENIQARSRGLTLMALSNKFGFMVLSTGNKSEMSVGYATLYGDMCGGYSVLKDVYKTTVFRLARWRNANWRPFFLGPGGEVMPERVIVKPPSAELKPDQKDEDSLPPYDMLDAILRGLIEEEKSRADLVARGFDAALAQRVWTMLDRAEYKRRQAPPGVKISSRAFGRDRRYPITNGFTRLIR